MSEWGLSWAITTMYEVEERELTGAELEELFEYLPVAKSPFRPFKQYDYGMVFIAEAWGAIVTVAILVRFGDVGLWRGILFGFAFLGVWWLMNLRKRILSPLRHWEAENRDALAVREIVRAKPAVRIHRVKAESAASVVYDDGVILLIDVGNNRTLWMDPYSMIPGVAPSSWPNREFKFISLPGSAQDVGPICKGTRFQPRETFDISELFPQSDFDPPEDGLVRQSLDSFLKRLRSRDQPNGE